MDSFKHRPSTEPRITREDGDVFELVATPAGFFEDASGTRFDIYKNNNLAPMPVYGVGPGYAHRLARVTKHFGVKVKTGLK